MLFWCVLSAILLASPCNIHAWNIYPTTDSPESWTGRWFPGPPVTPKPVLRVNVEDASSTRTMGISDDCDNGQINLYRDDRGDISEHICMDMRNRLSVSPMVEPLLEKENIPEAYVAEHKCMNESIYYDSDVPTFGPHRQLWPIYGEYEYLPPQRWLHSLEHGGIAGLFHPCADPRQISLFKATIKGCLWRHVITPTSALPANRPFAVVSWGTRLRMGQVDPKLTKMFIMSKALKGPERVSSDGQFSKRLISPADMVSDSEDTVLCPEP